MGFLFFSILLLPALLLYELVVMSLGWAASHMVLVNVCIGILLIFNLLFLVQLLHGRNQREKAGQHIGTLSKLAVFWEGCMVVLYGTLLIYQPLRYLPASFGELFSLDNNCYGVWTVIACQEITTGCTEIQTEIDAFGAT